MRNNTTYGEDIDTFIATFVFADKDVKNLAKKALMGIVLKAIRSIPTSPASND